MHEKMHLGQFATLGTWGFALRYALPSGRWGLEQPGWAAEIAAFADVYGPDALQARRGYYVDALTGKNYYWMISVAEATAWVDATIAAVLGTPTSLAWIAADSAAWPVRRWRNWAAWCRQRR
jgi:hypothetical protein